MSTGRPSYFHECKDRACHQGQFFVYLHLVLLFSFETFPSGVVSGKHWPPSNMTGFILFSHTHKETLTGLSRLIKIPTFTQYSASEVKVTLFNQSAEWQINSHHHMTYCVHRVSTHVCNTARAVRELRSNPRSSHGGRDSKMSSTTRVLDASVWRCTGQLAAASPGFSCHMGNGDQAAGWCEGHFGVAEADVSLDTMPLERSPCVVNRASAVREKHTWTALKAEELRGILRVEQPQTFLKRDFQCWQNPIR